MYTVLPTMFPLGYQGLPRDNFIKFGLLLGKSYPFEYKLPFHCLNPGIFAQIEALSEEVTMSIPF